MKLLRPLDGRGLAMGEVSREAVLKPPNAGFLLRESIDMNRQSLIVWQTLVFGLCCGVNVFASDSRAVAVTERLRGAQKAVVATTTSVTPGWRTNANGDRIIVSMVAL